MSIPKECKRLIEVDFPIAVVSKHSAREKSIRHGHPSTLHLWWARRPLAACRAVLMGLLLPDPADENCPKEFKAGAKKALLALPAGPDSWTKDVKTDLGLRQALLKFIGDFANWDLSSDPDYLACSRALVKAAHPEETPLVVDPFAGGGSIPLEALRLGCDAFASDLNPVACLILKVMLEDIPRHGPELAEELRRVGKEIKEKAEKELKEFYPDDSDGSKPIAYLWARTVRCEAPNCGAEIPLMRSFWLCKKASRKRALNYKVVRPKKETPRIEFEIFEPKKDTEVPDGTVSRAKAKCLACNTVLPPVRVRAQLADQRGGADAIFDGKGKRTGGARMFTVVTLTPGEQGRSYRLPTDVDYKVACKAKKRLKAMLEEWERGGKKGMCPVPDEPTPPAGGHRSVGAPRLYGMNKWSDLFSARQLISLNTLRAIIASESASEAAREIASLALSRFCDICNALCQWETSKTQVRHLFTRHDLPMLWDFAEASFLGEQAGDYSVTLETMVRVVERLTVIRLPGQVHNVDATHSPLPDGSVSVWFTDPPYYDAVAYADLSDFFYVWIKRVLNQCGLASDWPGMKGRLTPKEAELTVTTLADQASAPKTSQSFELGVASAFAEGRRVLYQNGVGAVVFAHKTTEGWEALLSGAIQSGWTITGSWPISTELGNRLNARDTASLAASVHLICRPRPDDAGIGDWGQVLRELTPRVREWMERLQGEGIRGADLVFACIGPALEIFSRYERVEKADGSKVELAEYLEKVWEVVGRIALEHVLGTAEGKATNSAGAAGALEEDARLTALFLWTLQSTNGEEGKSKKEKGKREDAEEEAEEDIEDEEDTGKKPVARGYSLIFDVVRRFAQPLGIHLPEWEDRIIKTEKGVVRLIPVKERAKSLFGEEGAQAVADRFESERDRDKQLTLFPDEGLAPTIKGKRKKEKGKFGEDRELKTTKEATTLDRVHAAMLLQSSGRTNALRALLKSELDRAPDFLRLANALSALYPKDSEEKRLLDAMLLAVPR